MKNSRNRNNNMMKTKLILFLMVLLGFAACNNQENEFEDFGSTACYFPFQRPARSIILGKYDLGLNENDNNHRFEIGITMGGVYENTEDRQVYFELAPQLLEGYDSIVKVLPASYYTIETASPVTIPAGSFKGRIMVQLTDAFFEDTLSFASLNQVNYAIPLLITGVENLDSVLSGKPLVDDPSRLVATDWEILPKDYTLYGIKFINKYHGIYLRRGVDAMTTSGGSTTYNNYHAEYVERDELVTVTTTGLPSVELSNIVRRGSEDSPGSVNMELIFDANGNCSIQSFKDDLYNVSGTGKFVENGGFWGGEERDAIFLEYSYTDAANNETHVVNDTLEVRDRNVVFEEFVLE
jgi:hypothetical protein